MREKRELKAHHTSEYNEFAKAINEKELVIYVEGNLYDEIKKKIKKEKRENMIPKTMGKFGMGFGDLAIWAVGFTPVGPTMLALGLASYLMGKGGEFKSYKIADNSQKGRLEMIRTKGDNSVDLRYDTILE